MKNENEGLFRTCYENVLIQKKIHGLEQVLQEKGASEYDAVIKARALYDISVSLSKTPPLFSETKIALTGDRGPGQYVVYTDCSQAIRTGSRPPLTFENSPYIMSSNPLHLVGPNAAEEKVLRIHVPLDPSSSITKERVYEPMSFIPLSELVLLVSIREMSDAAISDINYAIRLFNNDTSCVRQVVSMAIVPTGKREAIDRGIQSAKDILDMIEEDLPRWITGSRDATDDTIAVGNMQPDMFHKFKYVDFADPQTWRNVYSSLFILV